MLVTWFSHPDLCLSPQWSPVKHFSEKNLCTYLGMWGTGESIPGQPFCKGVELNSEKVVVPLRCEGQRGRASGAFEEEGEGNGGFRIRCGEKQGNLQLLRVGSLQGI